MPGSPSGPRPASLDHLPLVLEFARHRPDEGAALLQEYRASLELIRIALTERISPYADVVAAVCASSPAPRPQTGSRRMALAAAEGRPSSRWVSSRTTHDSSRSSRSGGPPLSLLLWGILPYVMVAVLVGGLIWRYRYDQFGWTTRSSQLYESRLLRIGSPLFHFGILW